MADADAAPGDGGSSAEPGYVRIHYLRPPDRVQLLVQRLLYEGEDVLVSMLDGPALTRTITIAGEVAAEPGSALIWFTFPGQAWDVGLFHRADGTFTGLYADIIEPAVRLAAREWRVVDLFLDIWIDAAGRTHLLDEDELQEALERGWITPETAGAARAQAASLLQQARAGTWPPPVVRDWSLARAREIAPLW